MSVDPGFMGRLELARMFAGIPFKIESGCRCEKHNAAQKNSVAGSAHVSGLAADIVAINSVTRWIVREALIQAGFVRIGTGKTFLHVDDDLSKPQRVEWVY
jgi:uncharacterized protein YcbK (DUF882 family)